MSEDDDSDDSHDDDDLPIAAVDLDETGWLLDARTGKPVPYSALHDYFADGFAPPSWATDLFVYVHGWQTSRQSAASSAARLRTLMRKRLAERPRFYPGLATPRFEPWMLVVRWPSTSSPGLRGYKLIRERAHAMGSPERNGHAAHVIGRLLGYLDTERPEPTAAPVLTNAQGQYLHLLAHSFGCRLLCEAVLWAADASLGHTLSWDEATRDPVSPFAVDSMLLFQMAAPRDAFTSRFLGLNPASPSGPAPIRGPIVATHSQHDRATGFWHARAEGVTGVGHGGIDPASTEVARIQLLRTDQPYENKDLDHPFVNVDATDGFARGCRLNPAGAHSTHICPGSAHLLLSLADFSRS